MNNKKNVRNFYAESQCESACDLFRFSRKKDRDDFVNDSSSCFKIKAAAAKKYHPEQFRMWNKKI